MCGSVCCQLYHIMKTIIALSLMAGAVAFAAPDMPRSGQPAPCPQAPGVNKPCPQACPGQDMRPGSQRRTDMNKHCPGSRPGHPVSQPKGHGPQPLPVPSHGSSPVR